MRVTELKALARDRGLRNYSQMRKAELVALLQNNPPPEPKVRDHRHYTGRYRGPTHSLCNLRYRIPSYILVVFHNLLGYDAHLFIKELGKNSRDMEVTAENKEDYISFSVDVAVGKYVK